jgi:dsRNA-specific ribonuclease
MSDIRQKIIFAPRGKQFTEFIRILLERSKIQPYKITSILNSNICMKRFKDAFTHDSADADNNYQFLEKIGDSCVNKCIRFYIIKRFPQLHNKQGVEFISELESKWKSTAYLSKFADQLGFKKFISADDDSINKNIRSRSEDVFEAFVGALELNIDFLNGDSAGYGVCYIFVSSMLNTINVKYTYEQLINSKSRLNELFLGLKDDTLKMKYITTSSLHDTNGRTFKSLVNIGGKIMGNSDDFNRLDKKYIESIGVWYKPPYRKKVVSEKVAAEVAIYNLIRQSKRKGSNLTLSVKKMQIKRDLNPFV